MGKGDRRTKKGKRFKGSYGKYRLTKRKQRQRKREREEEDDS